VTLEPTSNLFNIPKPTYMSKTYSHKPLLIHSYPYRSLNILPFLPQLTLTQTHPPSTPFPYHPTKSSPYLINHNILLPYTTSLNLRPPLPQIQQPQTQLNTPLHPLPPPFQLHKPTSDTPGKPKVDHILHIQHSTHQTSQPASEKCPPRTHHSAPERKGNGGKYNQIPHQPPPISLPPPQTQYSTPIQQTHKATHPPTIPPHHTIPLPSPHYTHPHTTHTANVSNSPQTQNNPHYHNTPKPSPHPPIHHPPPSPKTKETKPKQHNPCHPPKHNHHSHPPSIDQPTT